MRRLLGCGTLGLLALCVLGCVLFVVVALPNIRDEIHDDIGNAVSTQVAEIIPADSFGEVSAGRYAISASELQANIEQAIGGNAADIENVIVRVTSSVVELGFTAQGQEVVYSGVPVLEDGRVSFRNMDSNERVFEYLLPPDQLGDALADGINRYLAANGLLVNEITLQPGQAGQPGEIVLDLVPAS